jgi:uncharacterized protein (TIGR02266 family)
MADDRRRDPRHPAELLRARVRFVDRKQFERCFTKDISRGGIFLRTSKPSALDSPVEVTLELPGSREVKLHGIVVHCIAPDEVQPGQQAGLGVQFSDLTPKVRKGLEGVLAELSSPRLDAPVPPEPTPAAAPGRAAPPRPAHPAPPGEFDEQLTDPRGLRKTAPEGLIPDAPIIEEEFDARPTPQLAPAKAEGPPPPRARPITGAVPAVSPSKATVDTLRRMLWSFADVARLKGRTYYDVIGVARDAATIEILAACEALRRAFDLERPPAALDREVVERVAAVVALIGEIERCLCDTRRRAQYDLTTAHEPRR